MAEEKYYEITQVEADAIRKFSIDADNDIDPYCGKQTNGNWIISKIIVDTYSTRPEIKAVDFTGKTAKTAAQLDFEDPAP